MPAKATDEMVAAIAEDGLPPQGLAEMFKEDHPASWRIALNSFEAGRSVALRDDPLLAWLDMMNARVTWDTFAVGTPDESRQCQVSLRDFPISVTAPDFATAAETVYQLYQQVDQA